MSGLKTKGDLVSKQNFDKLRNLLSEIFGFRMSSYFSGDLERKFNKISYALGFDSVDKCINSLISGKVAQKEIEVLARELTIGETYFFRHEPTFEVLEKNIFPEVIEACRNNGKILRIWSAGCSSGEEPYSLAILLEKLIPDINSWNIKIFATDINKAFLERGKRGLYSKWSFRSTSEFIQKKYFKLVKIGQWEISNQVKKNVNFMYFNLIKDDFSENNIDLTDFDIILCNNVLIYFSEENIALVVDKLMKSLNKSGWLIVSPVEVPYIKNSHLFSKKFGRNTFFKKNGEKQIRLHKNINIDQFSSLNDNLDEKVFETINRELLDFRLDRKMFFQNLKDLYQKQQFTKVVEKLENQLNKTDWNEESVENLEAEVVLYLKSLANLGRCQEALEFCKNIIKKHKISCMIFFLYGVIQQELNNLDGAVSSFKKAIFLNSKFAIAHFYLGTLSLLQNEKKEAMHHFKNTLKLVDSMPSRSIIYGSDDITKEELCFTIHQLMEG